MTYTRAGSNGRRRNQPSQRAAAALDRTRAPPLPSAIGGDGWTVTRAIAIFPGRPYLLSVEFPDGVGKRLRLLQRGVDTGGAGDRCCELLRDLVTEVLKFRDVDVLDPGVGNRIHGGVVDVGMGDRVERQLREATGHLLIVRQLIGRGAGAGWNMTPAKLGPDQLDVVLRRGPGGEGPGGVLLGAGAGNAERPGPEPTRIGLVADRRQGVARVGRRVAGEVAGPDGGVVPHGGLAAVVRIQALAEAGVGGGGLAGRLDQIDVKVDG